MGPGQYGAGKSAIDITSKCKSFGVGWRAYDKLCRRKGEDAEFLGRESPGPGAPLWTDPSKDGSRGRSFFKAIRFPEDKSKLELS